MAGPPRILFFLPGLDVGGAERHTLILRKALSERGFETRLLIHGAARRSALLGVPGAQGAEFLGLKGMSDPKGWRDSWRWMREDRPDLVFAVNQSPLIVTAAVRLFLPRRPRLVCIFHTTQMQPFEKRLEGAFRRAVRFADCLVYVGAAQKRSWAARGVVARREIVIRNGVDLDEFGGRRAEGMALRAHFGLGNEDFVLGHVGAFRPEKNQIGLIEALALAQARGLRARAILVGDGPTREAVESRAGALGLRGGIIFAGEQADVAPFIAACDLGVICSTIETFPLAALEFLASGVPVAGADVGGVGEIVRDGHNGRLYPSGDVSSLADALMELSNGARRLPMAARAQASVRDFGVDAMTASYLALIVGLLRKRTSGH